DYTSTKDPDLRVEMLKERCASLPGPYVFVGSSMGGYVSLAAAQEIDNVVGIFALAPALYLPGYHWIDFPFLKCPDIEIVHGWRDEIAPVENSLRFARIHRARLHILEAEHRMHDAMDIIPVLFGAFLKRMKQAAP
ncbi:MAG: alpha/beta hydrolase, partial [Desulfovibrio sp.]